MSLTEQTLEDAIVQIHALKTLKPTKIWVHPDNQDVATRIVKRGIESALMAQAVHIARQHRKCGDAYPENGWPECNKFLADYAHYKRYWINA